MPNAEHTLSILWELVNGVKVEIRGIEQVLTILNPERFKVALAQGAQVLAGKPLPTTSQKWEIHVTRAGMDHIQRLVTELTTLGAEGWEPFHIHEIVTISENQYVVFSKRPLK